ASNPDAAPDVTPEINVRHPSGDGHDSGPNSPPPISLASGRCRNGSAAPRPGGPARTLLRAIKADLEGRGARWRPHETLKPSLEGAFIPSGHRAFVGDNLAVVGQ